MPLARPLLVLALFLSVLGLSGRPLFVHAQPTITSSLKLLTVARTFPATTITNTGVVFSAGGSISNSPYSTPVIDVYNAVTGTWSVSALSMSRGGIVAATVRNKSLFTGGEYIVLPAYTSHITDLVDVFDSATNTWSTDKMSIGRTGHATTTVLDRFALFAGGIDSNYEVSAVVDVYDVETNSWTVTALSSGRFLHTGVSLGSKAYFIGGLDYTQTLTEIAVYDVFTKNWTSLSLPVPLSGVAAAVMQDVVYIAGGTDVYGMPTTRMDIWVPATNSWRVKYFDAPRGHVALGFVPNRLVFFAGGLLPSGEPSSRVDIYNIATDSFIVTTLPSGPKDYISSAVYTDPVSQNTTILFLGGFTNGGETAAVDIYNVVGVVPRISRISRIHGSQAGGLKVSVYGSTLLGPDYVTGTVAVSLNGVPATVLSASTARIDFISGACSSSSCLGLGEIQVSVNGRPPVQYAFDDTQYASQQGLASPAWFYTSRDAETISATWSGGSGLSVALSTLLPANWVSLAGALRWNVHGHGNSQTAASLLFNSNSFGLANSSATIPSDLSAGGHNLGSSSIGIVHLAATGSDAVHYILFSVASQGNPNFAFHGALIVQEYLASDCPAVQRLGATDTPAGIPESAFTVNFDAATETFRFNVDLPYVTDSFSWIADFTPFRPASDNQNTIRAKTKCAHRRTDAAAGSAFDTTFATFPHALYNSAISPITALHSETGNTPYATPAANDGHSGKWTLQALSCSSVRLSAEFSVAELLSCSSADGLTPSVTVSSESTSADGGNSYLTYSGSLYLVYFRPFDRFSSPAETLYQTTTSTLPFKFRFARDLSAVQSFATTQTFTAGVETNNVDPDGFARLRLKTLYNPTAALSATMSDRSLAPSTGAAVASASATSFECLEDVASRGDANGECSNSSATAACVQFFDCISATVWDAASDNGGYRFTLLNGRNQALIYEVTLNHNIVRRATTDGLAPGVLALQIQTFDSVAAFNAGRAIDATLSFESGQSVYLRTDVVVPTDNAFRDLQVSYEAVYLCSPPLYYDVSLKNGHEGCLDAAIPSTSRILVFGSSVSSLPFVSASAAFESLLIKPAGVSPSATLTGSLGLRFNVSPLTLLGSLGQQSQWYIHVVGAVSGLGANPWQGGSQQQRKDWVSSLQRPQMLKDGSDVTLRRSSANAGAAVTTATASGMSKSFTVRPQSSEASSGHYSWITSGHTVAMAGVVMAVSMVAMIAVMFANKKQTSTKLTPKGGASSSFGKDHEKCVMIV